MKKLTRNKPEQKTTDKSKKTISTEQTRQKEQAQCCAKVSTVVAGCHD